MSKGIWSQRSRHNSAFPPYPPRFRSRAGVAGEAPRSRVGLRAEVRTSAVESKTGYRAPSIERRRLIGQMAQDKLPGASRWPFETSTFTCARIPATGRRPNGCFRFGPCIVGEARALRRRKSSVRDMRHSCQVWIPKGSRDVVHHSSSLV